MIFIKEVKKLISSWQEEKSVLDPKIEVKDSELWGLDINFSGPNGKYRIVSLSKAPENFIHKFREVLSPKSQELFCPYPWSNKEKLSTAQNEAFLKSSSKIDASFCIFVDNKPAGHFFLWKAGGNPVSKKFKVEVPELGIAMADFLQGTGLGKLSMNLLQFVAKDLGSDAIELTTAQSNDAGWHLYLKVGFAYTGDINNPLEVDVTEGGLNTKKFRKERQMIWLNNLSKKQDIYSYLESKRHQYAKLAL
jgi:RimJ/RimL family protein N-acetyltransferase